MRVAEPRGGCLPDVRSVAGGVEHVGFRNDDEVGRNTCNLRAGLPSGRVVRIFPNHESCLRLIRALAVDTHEDWLEANRYLNMDYLKELKKEQLRKAA